MRKITFLVLLFLSITALKAQTIFFEDFQAGIPSNFIIIDNDNKTPNAAVSYVTDAWVAHEDYTNAADTCAISTSWYTPAGQSDDWMILPKLTLTSGNYLIWRAKAQDPSYPDGYEVKISTTDSAMTSFTTDLYTTAAENPTWTYHAIDLSTYNNQGVWIAFRNNSSDKFVLLVDDITVMNVDSFDIAGIENTMLSPNGLNNAPFDVEGVIKNKGSETITSFDLNYSINGGTTVTSTISSVSIAMLDNYSFTHPTQWTPTAAGAYTIKVWASNLNGSHTDSNMTNDTITAVISIATQSVQRMPLYETFTSSTCGPCVAGNQNMDGLFAANPNKWVCVKYQMNWPGAGDPYFTDEGGTRRAFYGVNSVPRQEIDGGYDGNSSGVTQADFDAAYAVPSFMTITANLARGGNIVTVDYTIDPKANFPADAKLFIAIVEKETVKNVGSNGETKFSWVMKKMLPDGGGMTIGPLTAGTPVSNTVVYTFKGNYRLPANASSPINHTTENSVEDFNNLLAVVWVQSPTTGEVYQSALSSFTLGMDADERAELITAIYPNPANDQVNINLNMKQSENVNITIFNYLGQEVTNTNYGSMNGVNTLNIKLNNLSSGMYFVKITIGDKVYTKPLQITK